MTDNSIGKQVHRNRHLALLRGIGITILVVLGSVALAEEPSKRGLEIYGHVVAEVFRQHCAECHNPEMKKAKLDLSTREAMLAGGESGAAIVPGKADESLLYLLVSHTDQPFMPLKKPKLEDEQIQAIRVWINEGAPVPKDDPAKPKKEREITDADRQYWAFQPLRHSDPPAVKNDGWVRNGIDRFTLARMEAKGIAPNSAANRRTLIRRVYFDLIGLPPSPEQVASFVADNSTDAYEKVVDELLGNPHFGERWGRHWLDISRFAESHGYEQDYDRPYAFYFRDFVIRAFNDDLPFDTFVKWQIAGDEIEPENPLALMATGFLGAGTHSTQITKSQVEKERYDELDDMAGTVGTAMLGLTIGCARCHDHKFDPIPTRDYYRMLSTFTTTVRSNMDVNLDPEGYRRAHSEFDKEYRPVAGAMAFYEADALPAKFAQWMESRRGATNGLKTDPSRMNEKQREVLTLWFARVDDGWLKLHEKVVALKRREPQPNIVKMMVCSEGVPAIRTHTQGEDFLPETHFLKRGDPNQKIEVASQGFLRVLERPPANEAHWQIDPPEGWRTSYRRRGLASWITDTETGAGELLARVIVNRLWQHHLGRGLVESPSDFGLQGGGPCNPELLDYLAGELIRNGWRLKPIHKLILMSATFQQSAEIESAKEQADPANTLFWHYPRRRLEAEIVRDAMLKVSGTLDPTLFGPGTLDNNQKRRSIYFTVKRSKLVPMMILFDGPDSLGGMPRRPSTTIAPQALMMMNSQTARESAVSFAERLMRACGAGEAFETALVRVGTAYRLALGRDPERDELMQGTAFLADQRKAYRGEGHADADKLALGDFCQALLSLNEFIYVD